MGQLKMKLITGLIIVYLFVELCIGGEDEWELKAEIKCPVGLISMFYGDYIRIPKGYYLCDGTHGTPNLISKFIVGADPHASIGKYPYPPPYRVGTIGGQHQNVLKIENLPAHNHVIDPSAATTISGGGAHNTHTFNLNTKNSINSHHTHGINLNSQDENKQHTHIISQHTTGGVDDGEHSHAIFTYQDNARIAGGTIQGISYETIGNNGEIVNAKEILTKSVDKNVDGSHDHTIPSITTDTPNVGHSHQIFGNTDNDGTHDHNVDGIIDDGRHNHFIKGWTEFTGASPAIPVDNRPYFYAVYYICCVESSGNLKD
eukprot:483462_1